VVARLHRLLAGVARVHKLVLTLKHTTFSLLDLRTGAKFCHTNLS
jgi:hypothetical protein